MSIFRLFNLVKTKQLLYLFMSMLMYFLGGGIAHYYGANTIPIRYWLGLLWTSGILSGGFFLDAYFSTFTELNQDQEQINLPGLNKKTILQLAFFSLTVCGFVVVVFIINQSLTFALGIIFSLTILGLVINTYFSKNLTKKGYQEILFAIYMGFLIPTTSYFILLPQYHKFLMFFTFPMTLLALASFLAFDFSTFARDQRIDRKTFLRLLSWQTAIPVHNLLLLGSFAFIASGYFLGFPLSFVWPALLTLPLAGLQIYWLFRISRGEKPVWTFFNALSVSLLCLTAYFITYSFWII